MCCPSLCVGQGRLGARRRRRRLCCRRGASPDHGRRRRGVEHTCEGSDASREKRKSCAQSGLVESRRIARRRLAIRDSVKMSASAIRRFDQPRAQPVAPSTCRRAIEAETAERPRRAARARVARSRAARRAHLVAPGHARRISTDPGGVGPSLWPRGSRSAQSPLITGRCWPRAHGGGRRRRRRASPARPRSAGLPAESCRAAPPPPPSAASVRPSATQEGIAPRRIPPSGLLD